MKYYFSFVLVLFKTCFVLSQQNLHQNYSPLKSSGQLPAVFTQNVRNVIAKDIQELKNRGEADEALKINFITTNNYQIQRIITSGNALVNDEVTTYLNKLVDVILKDDPTLRSQINIYTLKTQIVNAYSFDKGYLFIDIGLIAQTETEAQLAYIICHEIAHFTKKHCINSFVKESKTDNHNERGSLEDKLTERCQYSKELESEADMEGLKLFIKTKYNVKQAVKAFDVLQYSHLPFELVEFNKSFFESPGYIIPNEFVLKKLNEIGNRSANDDSKSTHPNTARRKQDIGELMKFNDSPDRVNYVLSKESFEYARDLSRMEICKLYLKNRDYPNALYAAYILSQKFPDNQYLSEVISKCLYAISLYNIGLLTYDRASYLQNGIPPSSNIEGYPQQLYYFMNNMPATDWAILSLNYVYRKHKKFPENKILASYSDSLFVIMNKIDWNISDFTRSVKVAVQAKTDSIRKEEVSKTDFIKSQQKVMSKTEDSVYYKNVFVDLFTNDEEFVRKFPAVAPYIDGTKKTPIAFYDSKKRLQIRKLNKVLLLDPVYYKYYEKDLVAKLDYSNSDYKQEELVNLISNFSKLRNLELIKLDPKFLQSSEVDKINDYSVLNDWLSEKLDTEQDKSKVFNTNEMNNLISKYGVRYALKMGVVTVKQGAKTSTYLISCVYDLEKNNIVFERYERLRKKDKEDLIHAKVYQIIYDLTK